MFGILKSIFTFRHVDMHEGECYPLERIVFGKRYRHSGDFSGFFLLFRGARISSKEIVDAITFETEIAPCYKVYMFLIQKGPRNSKWSATVFDSWARV